MSFLTVKDVVSQVDNDQEEIQVNINIVKVYGSNLMDERLQSYRALHPTPFKSIGCLLIGSRSSMDTASLFILAEDISCSATSN